MSTKRTKEETSRFRRIVDHADITNAAGVIGECHTRFRNCGMSDEHSYELTRIILLGWTSAAFQVNIGEGGASPIYDDDDVIIVPDGDDD